MLPLKGLTLPGLTGSQNLSGAGIGQNTNLGLGSNLGNISALGGLGMGSGGSMMPNFSALGLGGNGGNMLTSNGYFDPTVMKSMGVAGSSVTMMNQVTSMVKSVTGDLNTFIPNLIMKNSIRKMLKSMGLGNLASGGSANPLQAQAASYASAADATGMPTSSDAPVNGSLADKAIAWAKGEAKKGISNKDKAYIEREYSKGQNHVDGKEGSAWCADFVSTAYEKANGGKAPWGHQASVDAIYKWGRDNGHFFKKGAQKPGKGDVIIFGTAKDGTHTGIVTGVDPDGTIHTIEGNSSHRVKENTYKPGSQGGIVGFVRP